MWLLMTDSVIPNPFSSWESEEKLVTVGAITDTEMLSTKKRCTNYFHQFHNFCIWPVIFCWPLLRFPAEYSCTQPEPHTTPYPLSYSIYLHTDRWYHPPEAVMPCADLRKINTGRCRYHFFIYQKRRKFFATVVFHILNINNNI
jgi:hypothetical protein